ncbi:MAG: F0F1 ATP synthase subunit delta [Leptospirales bacterium]
MKIGKKARSRAKNIVQYALTRIGDEDSAFTRWDRSIEVLETFRFNRRARTLSLDRSVLLSQKQADFIGIVESSSGESAPEGFDILLGGLILEDLWDALPLIRAGIRKEFYTRTGQVDVTITSSEILSDPDRQKLTQTLSGSMGNRRVKAHWNTDPGLIAGLVVQSGTHVWDGSLKGRLNQLKKELLDWA